MIAEDILLLLLDDDTGKPQLDSTRLDLALAGAVVLELATANRVRVTGDDEEVRAGRLIVEGEGPVGDPVLDDALRGLADHKPRKTRDALSPLSKGLREKLLDRLTERGILRREDGRVLGVFATKRWPAADVAHETEQRRSLHDVLVTGRTPSPREMAVISLLHAVDQVPKAVGDTDVPKNELKNRAKKLSEGEFAGKAVSDAVAAVQAAVTAAVIASSVAATSGAVAGS